ncbi:hypothetical protein IGB42_02629 [Andreprevotia sp. IGB-42]|uniref:phage tail protein n=1 Tax=Andreprevotia sp. IGB-42 TaxID=2497473 RepID=UPI00135AB311|nr:phage tail protein [Andreprevotia sp. IGB-42]KAF0812786.1 hypothetical protein IGB42_02629 [Andreprevotia sp. IGB-42]
MTLQTFSWIPDNKQSEKAKARVRKTPFAKGFVQRARDGLNNIDRSIPLSFTVRELTEVSAINAFLTAHGGVTPFLWTSPTGQAGKWICEEWEASRINAVYGSLTATFTLDSL